jgi:hypothetical protein
MGDLIFVAVVVAFFAATVVYLRGCEHIVGRDEVAGAPGSVDAEAGDAAAALEGSGGGRR